MKERLEGSIYRVPEAAGGRVLLVQAIRRIGHGLTLVRALAEFGSGRGPSVDFSDNRAFVLVNILLDSAIEEGLVTRVAKLPLPADSAEYASGDFANLQGVFDLVEEYLEDEA